MGLTMHERHAVTRQLTARYQKATKKERGQILDEFTALTGYARAYARFMLRNCGRKLIKMFGAERVVYTCAQARTKGAKRRRGRRYGTKAFLEALKRLWALSDGLCGKRLAVFIRETIPHLERAGELEAVAEPEVREQLLSVSAATLDRVLRPAKREARPKGQTHTRPGNLLKQHIPVRTFADWNDAAPGFGEMDLVAHDGGAAFGDYCHTLTLTDIATCWTETYPVKNKAQVYVFAGLKQIRFRLPFPLRGVDSDNGSEFINHELLRYCELEHLTFTRSRAYKKNDNCFVEQKNNSVVRRALGYYRYDRPEQLELLEVFAWHLRLFTNFFQPVMKLQEKVRIGSRLTRRYDTPQTPYRRVLAHPLVGAAEKDALRETYEQLNLIVLKRTLNELQAELFHAALAAPPIPRRWAPPLEHPWRESTLASKGDRSATAEGDQDSTAQEAPPEAERHGQGEALVYAAPAETAAVLQAPPLAPGGRDA